MSEGTSSGDKGGRVYKYVPAGGPRLKKLLYVVLGLFSLLFLNGAYLVGITIAEWSPGEAIQNYFYLNMFLVHLVLGVILILPFLVFGIIHIRNSHDRKNRIAVRVGYALFVSGALLILSGGRLTRGEGLSAVKEPLLRNIAYWAHVLSPVFIIWLFILHRLAGPKIQWRKGLVLAAVSAVFAVIMIVWQYQDPRKWNEEGPDSGTQYFFPSLSRTATGNFIPADTLMMDHYCKECHADAHEGWSHGVHRFSSFNNPAYLFSVRETRKAMMERDGNVQGSRFCAGCHDPVPFFSGAFDTEKAFDDPEDDLQGHRTAQAGITCTVCHAITHLNSPRGNSDYTIEEPMHYPFAFSENGLLRWVNRQLVKAKPAFHKMTFLKPLHKTPEFCGTCHKVHLPEELNKYKWLRGQNHYDAYHLSGVSGHGVTSFYYPPKAQPNCNGCHMPLERSDDFAAGHFDSSGELKIHGHQFPSANTAIPHLLKMPPRVNDAHRKFLEGVMRLDIFGIKKGGRIDGELTAPLRPEVPALEPGATYLVEVIIRTMKMGHIFTQGTADSNEIWMDIDLRSGAKQLGRSGGRRSDGGVDPWSHFVNAYVLDRKGNRIDRRNAQDIFVPLYSHQIPPGAADVIHYTFKVPEDASGTLTLDARLQYRKCDTIYMQYIYGKEYVNDLPIVTLAADSLTFPVAGKDAKVDNGLSAIPEWQLWNDYGIGLIRKGSKGAHKGELRQAEGAFSEVERLKRADGPLNLARVYVKEGRLEEAVAALRRAAAHEPSAPPWTVSWFTGVVNKQNGHLDDAIKNFLSVANTEFEGAAERGFDFGQDYRVLNELGQTYFERAKQERGDAARPERNRLLGEAVTWFEKVLAWDPENLTAHYNLALVHTRLGNEKVAAKHRVLHLKYKPDDNARDSAVAAHRARNPAANHAAESIVIYDLQKPENYELGEDPAGPGKPK
ncbi:MAG: tetratricopeptide repeat protein [Planctomycetes bacterium]|nr:tetratricopeptide repeat protein [Planctomycetota bacterium]